MEYLYGIKELRNKRAHSRHISAQDALGLVELTMTFFSLANFPDISSLFVPFSNEAQILCALSITSVNP
jgi:hypothetical protein